ncbi:MAG: phosphoenolpyruvate carboxykinase [Hyphomicrobiales bacterium]|nr:phosphoenolpyruvate carboxykinase [Hyphomicrobiales bacterium]
MKQTGVFNRAFGADKFELRGLAGLNWNLGVPALYEAAIRNGEGVLAANGPFAAVTGQHTGRSPKDKFLVRTPANEAEVWWDNVASLTPDEFDLLRRDFLKHAEGMALYAQDLYAGADPAYRLPVRVYCEYAWHALFIRHMLIRPPRAELAAFKPRMTIIDLPSFKADPARHGTRSETIIACDFDRGMVLIGNSSYAGEMKKSVFSYLCYALPKQGVMPMHCSANVGAKEDSAAFFGLSGTGKTTLSADPNRTLIGDDEHGWSKNGIFNFEGGCYAKTINLSAAAEPEIYATTQRFGTVFENVVIDPETREPDFDDGSLTENTRCAYPVDFIPNASMTGLAPHPMNLIMLTADAFGVMPPIAKLSASQAMYHFLSGYTAKVAGTEKGMGHEPAATFSTCFGAPFMSLHPTVYGNLLRELIGKHATHCWLVNTGWTGGPYGVGRRMPIKATRALLTAVLDGSLAQAPMRVEPSFGFEVPLEMPGVDRTILTPRETWADKKAYDEQARRLVQMFIDNFTRFESRVEPDVRDAAPVIREAAE